MGRDKPVSHNLNILEQNFLKSDWNFFVDKAKVFFKVKAKSLINVIET